MRNGLIALFTLLIFLSCKERAKKIPTDGGYSGNNYGEPYFIINLDSNSALKLSNGTATGITNGATHSLASYTCLDQAGNSEKPSGSLKLSVVGSSTKDSDEISFKFEHKFDILCSGRLEVRFLLADADLYYRVEYSVFDTKSNILQNKSKNNLRFDRYGENMIVFD